MAKKSPTVIRTSISVPQALKRRMQKVKEDVNWSSLACEAFQAKLAEIASRKKEKDMSDVIERLRESKRKGDTEAFAEGRTAGTSWAESDAEAQQLERLEAFEEELELVCGQDEDGSAYGPLCFAINPELAGSWEDAEWFWDQILDDTPEGKANRKHPDFLRGFADGALDVWRGVKDQL